MPQTNHSFAPPNHNFTAITQSSNLTSDIFEIRTTSLDDDENCVYELQTLNINLINGAGNLIFDPSFAANGYDSTQVSNTRGFLTTIICTANYESTLNPSAISKI